jgi:negative regulator of flagellin synthesis FlgM
MSYVSVVGSPQSGINSIAPSGTEEAMQANRSKGLADEGGITPRSVDHADETSLSTTGGLVAQALQGSDIRSSKVTSLQQAIAANNYIVSSSDVADKILQSLGG